MGVLKIISLIIQCCGASQTCTELVLSGNSSYLVLILVNSESQKMSEIRQNQPRTLLLYVPTIALYQGSD